MLRDYVIQDDYGTSFTMQQRERSVVMVLNDNNQHVDVKFVLPIDAALMMASWVTAAGGEFIEYKFREAALREDSNDE